MDSSEVKAIDSKPRAPQHAHHIPRSARANCVGPDMNPPGRITSEETFDITVACVPDISRQFKPEFAVDGHSFIRNAFTDSGVTPSAAVVRIEHSPLRMVSDVAPTMAPNIITQSSRQIYYYRSYGILYYMI